MNVNFLSAAIETNKLIVMTKKSKGTKGASPERANLTISSVRISTPFKNIQFDAKNIGSISVRGQLTRRPKNFFG